MNALVLRHWGGMPEPAVVPDPVAQPGEARLRVVACGVGLTTRNCIRGDLCDGTEILPVVPGHEVVGVVDAVGPGADPELAGRLVTAHFYLFCGRCPACLRNEEPMCLTLAGVIGVHRDGGLAQSVSLPDRNVVTLPPDMDPVEATVVADAVATPVHVARRAGIVPGTRVLVIGAGGGVGVHMVQVAAWCGGSVAGIDVSAEKLAFLHDELHVAAIDGSDLARVALPAGWCGQADVVVDLVGSADSMAWALPLLAAGARLVVLTTFPGVASPVSARHLVLRQASIVGSRYASRGEILLAADLVDRGIVRPVVGARTDLLGAVGLLEQLERGDVVGRGAVVMGARP